MFAVGGPDPNTKYEVPGIGTISRNAEGSIPDEFRVSFNDIFRLPDHSFITHIYSVMAAQSTAMNQELFPWQTLVFIYIKYM